MQELTKFQLYEHGGKFGCQIGMFMPGGFWVPKCDIVMAWRNAKVRFESIAWTQKVGADAFFEKQEWKEFPFGKKLALGRCIKFFCVEGLLPIEVANPGKKGRRYYTKKH